MALPHDPPCDPPLAQAVLTDAKAALEEKQWAAGLGGGSGAGGGGGAGAAGGWGGSAAGDGSGAGGAGHTDHTGRWSDRSARGDVMRWCHIEEEEAAGRGGLAGLMRRVAGLRSQLQSMG